MHHKFYVRWTVILGVLLFLFSGCSAEKAESHKKTDYRLPAILEKISRDSIEANIRKLTSFHTRHTTSDTVSDSVGIGAARRWIFEQFQQYRQSSDNRLKVKYDRYTEKGHSRIKEPTEIVNIVGILPGRQLESKDRMYVVSGHYDSRVSDIMNDSSYAPGANDNASGAAAVMELARVISQHQFDATIIFMTVAGKEQGLLGAEHFARKAKKRNMNIAAMFTNDLIGNTTKSTDSTINNNEIRVFTRGIPPDKALSQYHRTLLSTGGENDTPSRQLGRFMHRMAENYVPGLSTAIIYRQDRYLRDGDHTAFLDKGFPALRLTEPHEYYERQHKDVRVENGIQYGDLPEFIEYPYVAKVTKLNAAALITLANAPARPEGVKVDVSQLDNNTSLYWQRNAEPDLDGYEIVWRETHNPFWQHSEFIGDTTAYTVKGLSKDNYFFGVRSVDKYGNKSPAVYPLPKRN